MSDNVAITDQSIGPVRPPQRIASIDVLRGVALLGILAINIDFFSLPMMIYSNPMVAGGFTGLDLLTWKFDFIIFLQKMMAIFSMLFGAGVILMYKRAEAAGVKFTGTYYRRILWLLLIGLIHAYFFWYGDILVTYALCGLILYPLRRTSPRFLIILGVVFLLLGGMVSSAIGFSLGELKNVSDQVEEALDEGKEVDSYRLHLHEQWQQMRNDVESSREQVNDEIETYRGGWDEVMPHRVRKTIMMQTQGLLIRVFWRVMGLMLLGMAFMKLGIFSGERSTRFYMIAAVIGYGIGLPVVGYGMGSLMGHGFDIIYFFKIGSLYNFFGSVLVAIGHVSLVILIFKQGWLQWLTRRLAAVGRMALSNYWMHTLICTTLFYGYGFGLFGHINRFGLFGIVVAIWILQLLISPVWLKRFRFGPAEWLWRTMTYLKPQPMRVRRDEINA